MLIGYARTSTPEQSLELQRDALKQAGCTKIYEDQMSGVKASRPGLSLMLDVLRSGDTLVVWRLDRLGRSLKELIEIAENLQKQDVELQSLREGISTHSAGGKLIFHLFGALAEFERELIRERTCAGIASARARGRVGGRPKALDPAKRKLVVQLYNEKQYTVNEICKLMNISKPTLYSYVDEKNLANKKNPSSK